MSRKQTEEPKKSNTVKISSEAMRDAKLAISLTRETMTDFASASIAAAAAPIIRKFVTSIGRKDQ